MHLRRWPLGIKLIRLILCTRLVARGVRHIHAPLCRIHVELEKRHRSKIVFVSRLK